MHLIGRKMHPLAVAGQDPLEAVVRQPRHRLGLLRPRVPAVVLGSREPLLVAVPGQVVAGEEEAIVEQQDAVALRCGPASGWRGSRGPAPTGRRRRGPPPHRAATTSSVRWMMRRAPKCCGVAVGVGHVVPVGQEDVGDAAQRLQPPHQRRQELRRVDQPVAGRVADEVAVAAVGLRRVEAAVVDRPLDRAAGSRPSTAFASSSPRQPIDPVGQASSACSACRSVVGGAGWA